MLWWLVFACGSQDVVSEQLNADEQDLVVLVKPECTAGETAPTEIPLLSNVGGIELGYARVDPACGPMGSEHELFVEVYDDYQDLVDDALITAIPEAVSDLDGDGEDDARDRATYSLERDGADTGVFAITLQSLGASGEVREDRWRVTLVAFVPEDEQGGLLSGLTQ